MLMKEPINDIRLTPTMERVRNGPKQCFKERKDGDRSSASNNPDVVLVHSTDVAMYAELIDGVWYWVTGCAECKGEERDWMSYVECDKHNRCSVCSINSKDLPKGITRWGGKRGWTCGTCQDAKNLAIRQEAFDKLDGEEPDSYNTDEPICPHCGTQLSSDELYETQDINCHVCDGEIKVEVEFSRSFTTRVKGKRIKK